MKKKFIDIIPEQLQDKICLMGLQGSRALGMQQTEDADYDYRGVFLEDTNTVLSIYPYQETIELGDGSDNNAEFVFHEFGKFIKLCMKGNPSVIQILFLNTFNLKNNVGSLLVANKHNFIGAESIKKSFGGYALAQAKRLNKTGSFSKGRKRSKHIRHIFRLFDQAIEILQTGELTYPLKNAQKYIDFGNNATNEQVLKEFETMYKKLKSLSSTIIPDYPNQYLINEIVLQVRNGEIKN